MGRLRLLVGLTLVTAIPGVLHAGPAERCRQQKNLAAGKHAACRQRAEGRSGTAGDVVRLTSALLKCDQAFERRWANTEATAAGNCPTVGDLENIEAVTREHTTNVAILLAGSTPSDCPGQLATCLAQLAMCPLPCGPASSLPLETEQTTCIAAFTGEPAPCPGTGMDGETQTGVARLYADNGDGTIRDVQTGLVWEKLGVGASLHGWDGIYSWSDALAVKIASLNTPPCFAGHCDWRLPNVTELRSLVTYDRSVPATSPDFAINCVSFCTPTTCNCMRSDPYWTSTTAVFSDVGVQAITVDFRVGASFTDLKAAEHYVRAVRGGA